jgi:hypothetical protein
MKTSPAANRPSTRVMMPFAGEVTVFVVIVLASVLMAI